MVSRTGRVLEQIDGADGKCHARNGNVGRQDCARNERDRLKWTAGLNCSRARLSVVDQTCAIQLLTESSEVPYLHHRAFAQLLFNRQTDFLDIRGCRMWVERREADARLAQDGRGKIKASNGWNEIVALSGLLKHKRHVVHLIAPE